MTGFGIAAAGLALLVAGCGGGPGDTVEVTKTRLASVPSHQALPDLSLVERVFGRDRARRMQSQKRGGARPGLPGPVDGVKFLNYTVPDGWEELPVAQFRDINLRLPGTRAEIVLTFLQSDGGGLVANVDRWRGQVQMPPMTQEEIAALETRTVFNQPATYVELFGPYRGMMGGGVEEGAIFGAIFSKQGGTLFAKMTGEKAVLEAQRGGFHVFLDSLGVNPDYPTEPSPHGGASASGAAGAKQLPPSPLTWAGPEGWTEVPRTNQFREVTFVRDGLEMYVSTATGGAFQNIKRWAGQLGLPAPDEASLGELERVPMMGVSAYIFDEVGTLKGMRDKVGKPGSRMLAALAEKGSLIVTVKMTGPDAQVAAARPAFLALVGSLKARQNH